tara:strand:+ start:13968 stop:14615 length:648 start_codon:yes stop_codon:yes gene_type:complete
MEKPKNDVNRIVYDTTFIKDAIEEMPFKQREKENLMTLLSVIASRFDKVNKSIITMTYSRFLDNAEGDMLEGIAYRFNIPRGGKTDEELRTAIKLHALKQDMEGTRDEIVKLLRVILQGDRLQIKKSENNNIEILASTVCIGLYRLREELEDIFPINTQLRFGIIPVGRKPFGTVSIHNTEPEKSDIGQISSVHKNYTDAKNSMSVLLIYSEGGA